MRAPHADYEAIEAALRPHQLQTLLDLAVAAGLPSHHWWKVAVARLVAKDLAVANIVAQLRDEGLPQRQAVNKAASRFDLDTETLQRRYRKLRRHGPA